MEERQKIAVVGALMLVAGGMIGAGAALLFAPQSGKKTRRDLFNYARKIRRRSEGVVEEFSAKVSDMVEEVGDRAEEILGKGPEMANEAKKDLLKVFEKGQAKLEKQRSRLARLIG